MSRSEIGVGPTTELSLRVSVATLVRLLFRNRTDGDLMLALERRGTLRETEYARAVEVKCQPFGGAIRILNLDVMRELLGDFQFDSERSFTERDFRIFIRPSAWPLVREFCLRHLDLDNDPILETDPRRELGEELAETLGIRLKPEQYVSRPVATMVENDSTPTNNIHAQGRPTVRVYRVFEASITDLAVADLMLKRSDGVSHEGLCELAIADAKNGGRGVANAILSLPWERVQTVYQAMLPAAWNAPIIFDGNQLDATVAAVLDELTVPRYQRV